MIAKFKYFIIFVITLSSCFATTVYTPGDEDGTTIRRDTITIGAAGNLNGYATPFTAKTIYINFVQSGTPGAAATAATTIHSFPPFVKDIWLTGDATGMNTVSSVAQYALPTPPAGATIHFQLTTAPLGATVWFQNVLPSTCKVSIEPSSADPILDNIFGFAPTSHIFDTLVLGSNITIPATITRLRPRIIRHYAITEGEASAQARLTMSTATTFSRAVTGISLAGAYLATFDENSTIVDPATNTIQFSIAAGKKLQLIGSTSDVPWMITAPVVRSGATIYMINRGAPLVVPIIPLGGGAI